MGSSKQRLLILYGSETGTCQDLAEQCWRQSRSFGFSGPVLAMDDYPVAQLIEESVVLLICSTTGQGEEPENMKNFWRFLLRKSLPTDSLAGLHFGVLGLGDSSYLKFNYVAKRLHKRLTQLSGKALVPLGLCDDQHDLGPSAVYLNWIKEFFVKVKEVLRVSNGPVSNGVDVQIMKWEIRVKSDSQDSVTSNFSWPEREGLIDFVVEGNKRATELDHFQDVRLISFDAKNVEWLPGDVFVVIPSNDDAQVAKLFDLFHEHRLDFDASTVVTIHQVDKEMPVPSYLQHPMTLKTVAKYIWDLNAVPRQRTFELLSVNCTNELEKEKLIEFTTPEGLEDLFTYTSRPRRTILEVLGDFPHAASQLTLPILFELFQTIKPRSFSIASNHESGLLDILVAVVHYKTILSEPRKGLCSNWLKDLQVGEVIQGSIRRGTMKIPKDLSTPIIMVGPGTGVAPFRSLLLDREYNKAECKLVLFFGCRSQYKDFYFKENFKRLEEMGLLNLFCAFSRDQEHKIYVQHVIENQSDVILELLKNQNCHILVAGNSKNMPTAVKDAFIKVAGADLIENLIKQNRYQEETWS